MPDVIQGIAGVDAALAAFIVEAEQVIEILKRRKVPVEYVLFPDEGHGWRKTPNRVRSTVEIVASSSATLKANKGRSASRWLSHHAGLAQSLQ